MSYLKSRTVLASTGETLCPALATLAGWSVHPPKPCAGAVEVREDFWLGVNLPGDAHLAARVEWQGVGRADAGRDSRALGVRDQGL